MGSPAPSGRSALPDQVSQSNLDALVDSLPDSLFLRDILEIPAQSFLFPAGLSSLTIIITDPDGEELIVVLIPELLGCNATGTVCNIPVTRLLQGRAPTSDGGGILSTSSGMLTI